MLVAGLEACQEPQPAIQSASGLVISVDGPDVARVERFTLRTADGMQLQFEVESLALDGGGKPAPHLREHMVSGEPIEVDFYRGCCDQLVALRYRDAHDAGPTPAGSPTPLGGNDG